MTLVTAAVEIRNREPGTAQDKRKDGRYAGRVRLSVAADRSADSLCSFVEGAVMPASLIVTDDWSGYGSLRTRGYDHHAISSTRCRRSPPDHARLLARDIAAHTKTPIIVNHAIEFSHGLGQSETFASPKGPLTVPLPTSGPECRLAPTFQTRFRGTLNAYL
jgi:hypothetical protein